ncbi:MAG: hypothetical protein O7D91_05010 [Planctomycetota bacterium]|nr:hypothetical protein [Planctomycetota bacterium]
MTRRELTTMTDRDKDELLLEYLRANDAPCPLCGYNLHQLTTTKCPECGRPFQLGIESVSPFFAHYLGFLAPFVIGAGLGFVFLCLIFAWGPPGSWGIFIVIAAGGVDVMLLAHWYRKRVNFHRRPDEEKRKLILAAWLIHVVVVAIGLAFTSP